MLKEGIGNTEIDQINQAIRKGVRKVLPARLLSRTYVGIDPTTGKEVYSETQIADDIRQDVWVKLLEKETLDTKAAFNWARRQSKDWERREFRTMPVSQMNLPLADPEDDDSEGVMPWDAVDLSKPAQLDPQTGHLLSHLEDAKREYIFAHTPQKDRRFLTRYCSKKVKHSPANWKRFQRLTESMKKLLIF
jgi:hypothetical protein